MSRAGFRYFFLLIFKKFRSKFTELRTIIRLLTVVIVLLPVTVLFFVTYATFIDLSNEWRTIRIRGGNHSYYPSVQFIRNLEEIEFYFMANESWYYAEPERNGWSKIRGFSKGLHHESGSARLVYKCVDDTLLLIGGYCYVDGVHPNDGIDQQAVIDTIKPGVVYYCRIAHEEDKYKFYFEEKYWECNAGKSPSWGYMLNPFIGGIFTLEHDWTIDIVDIRRSNSTRVDAIERSIVEMRENQAEIIN
jgi:hypothetical protein